MPRFGSHLGPRTGHTNYFLLYKEADTLPDVYFQVLFDTLLEIS